MKLGERFKTISGLSVTLVAHGSNITHPLIFLDDRKRLHNYTREGKFISDLHPHPMDVVNETKTDK